MKNIQNPDESSGQRRGEIDALKLLIGAVDELVCPDCIDQDVFGELFQFCHRGALRQEYERIQALDDSRFTSINPSPEIRA